MYKTCIDVGGTFTDCLVLDEAGNFTEFKSPTTPEDPSLGVINSLSKAATHYRRTLEEFSSQIHLLVHGTTLSTNALLTGKGAKVGMITTKGFRDVIEIRRGFKNIRTSMFNVFVPPYRPLVPRRLRVPVRERTLYDGKVRTPLNERDLRAAIKQLKAEGVEAVAVCFLHSYANPENEKGAAQICRDQFNGTYVTASHEILPVWREHERFSTTVVSAYVGPITSKYLNTLEERLKAIAFKGTLLIVQSDGLVQSVEHARKKAVYLIASGPAAAPQAARYCGELANCSDLISIDMGGTSLDVSLVRNGEVHHTTESWVGDERVAIKMVDIHSAGAGGGSKARIDSLGLLRVGPESAGAEPGPACYGKGGKEPTVTDADLVLGYIPGDFFLGGEIQLDVELARKAVKKIGDRLGLGVSEAAQAIFTTVNSLMADEITELSTKRGQDVRDFALVVGGGAGPVHGAHLAEQLGIPTVIVPRFASLYSAFGMFAMDIGRDYVRSHIAAGSAVDAGAVTRLFQEMEAEAKKDCETTGASLDDLILIRSADMRYVGQFHEVEVGGLPGGILTRDDMQTLIQAFHERHQKLYTFAMPFREVELLNLRLKAVERKAELKLGVIPRATGGAAALKRKRPCFFKEQGGYIDTPVYDGDTLRAGNIVQGPALIEERTTTVVIPESFACKVDIYRNYILTHQNGKEK
jgi:N-methylhydantoinase A